MKFLLQSHFPRRKTIALLLLGINPILTSFAQAPSAPINPSASSLPLSSKVDISSDFGMRADPFSGLWQEHRGIDLKAQFGSPILATNAGTVNFAGYLPGYGNTVEIDHGQGVLTRYGHAERVLVKSGDLVQASQTIAYVGSSGRSTGPHLHFEVSQNHSLINPRGFLGDKRFTYNAYATLTPFSGKAIRVQYVNQPRIPKTQLSKHISSDPSEIKPRIIYLSNK